MKKIVSICFLLVCAVHVQSQDIAYEGTWRPTFSVRQSANLEDYILGFTIGVSPPVRNLNTYASFDFRPYRKKVQEHTTGNHFNQYAERRFFVGLGAEYLHRLNNRNKGVFASMNGNYTWGNYGGTERKPQKGYVLVPRVGFFMTFFQRTTFLRLGYEYLDTNSDVLEHRLFFSVTGVIGKEGGY